MFRYTFGKVFATWPATNIYPQPLTPGSETVLECLNTLQARLPRICAAKQGTVTGHATVHISPQSIIL
jgi:hypothetical protein